MRNTSYVSSVDSTGPEEANLQIFAIYGVQEALTVLFMDHLLRKSKWKCLEFGSQVSPCYHYFLGLQCFIACMAVHSIDTSLVVKPWPCYEPQSLATPTSDSSLFK